MLRPILLSPQHAGTRFTHNFLVHIGCDPLRLFHVGAADLTDDDMGKPFVIPLRDPKLCFLSHWRRDGSVTAWRRMLDRTLVEWEKLERLIPNLDYVTLRVDGDLEAELTKVHAWCGGLRPVKGFSLEPVSDYGDFPTSLKLYNVMAEDWSIEQRTEIEGRLARVRESFGYGP